MTLLQYLYRARIFHYFVHWPTNAQLTDKLSHSSYMFRHYCVILREFVVSLIPTQTRIEDNETADKLAKEAAHEDDNINTAFDRIPIISVASKIYRIGLRKVAATMEQRSERSNLSILLPKTDAEVKGEDCNNTRIHSTCQWTRKNQILPTQI